MGGYERLTRSYSTGVRNSGRTWTLEIMTRAIVALKENNEPVNAGFLMNRHTNLYEAIKGMPGGWKKIVEMAGFDPTQESRIHLRGKGYVSS